MKKGTFLALALAGCLFCAPLVACGDEEEKKDPPSGQPNDEQGITLTEDTDFEALVSEKVTAAVWDAAFSSDAFAGCSWTHLEYDDGELDFTIKGSFGYKKEGAVTEAYQGMLFDYGDGDLFEQSTFYRLDAETMKFYFPDGEGGYYYSVIPLTELEEDDLRIDREWATTFRTFSIDLAGHFSDFTYDETLSAYTYESTTGIEVAYSPFEAMGPYTVYKAVIKIVNGKVAYQHVVIEESEYTLCCYDFGKTAVSYPANALPAPMDD